MTWHAIPFVRVVIPCMAGILLGFHHSLAPQWVLGSLLLYVIYFALQKSILLTKTKYQSRFINGLLLSVILMLMTWLYTFHSQTIHQGRHFSKINKIQLCQLNISEVLSRKDKYNKYYATVELAIDSFGRTYPAIGKILVYAYGDSNRKIFERGDKLLVKGKIQATMAPVNEGDFDYQFYLSTKDIHHSIRINEHSIKWIDHNRWQLMDKADKIRSICNDKIKTYISAKQNYGVAEALLLGYKYDIDTDINQVFARTGTLHVLAVSGMHVGLIYGLLLWLCGFIGTKGYKKLIRFLLLLIGIWGYALLSGLGASILRATVMFSFMSLAQLTERKTQSFNLLAASAFFLFLNEPLCLFDPGFQLSYSAVTGIIFLYPILRPFCQFNNKIGTYIAELLALTIAAQIFTLPFSLFYFGQFPNLFLVANLVIIPLSTILIFGLIALAIVPFDRINELLGKCLEYGLDINYQFARLISSLPHAVSENLYIDIKELIALLILSCLFIAYLYLKNNKLIILSMVLICLLMSKNLAERWNKNKQCEISFYTIKYKQVPICLSGTEALIVTDSFNINDSSFSSQSLKKYFSMHGIRTFRFASPKNMFVSTNFLLIPELGFQFFDKTMTIDKMELNNRPRKNHNKN